MTPSSDAPSSLPSPARPKLRRRVRRRFRLLLALTLLVCLLVSPQVWQAALRRYLTWQADRRGWELTIGGMEGGLFDATVLYDVRCRRRAPWPIDGSGTLLRVARAEFVPAWRVPYFQPPAPSWIARLTLDGVDAQLSIPVPAADKDRPPAAGPRAIAAAGLLPAAAFDLPPWLERDAVPADMELIHANVRVQRGPFSFEVAGARLTAYHDGPGQFFARSMTVRGPGYENTLPDRHGLTFWKQPDRELTFANLPLNRWTSLTSLTLDFSRLRRHKLDWDASLTALGGEIHSQGKATFARGRVALDVGGSLQSVGVRQMARLLGIGGQTDGNIEQGTFSFRGDPERWTEATFSLSAQAADFRWRERAWQRLELRAVVVNRRVQVGQLELRQNRNALSFSGECALPPADPAADAAWWKEGFSGSITAKLEDLGALARLLGPDLPEVDGRMSVNGRLRSLAQGSGFDGYLNVEGSGLKIRGAPLDYLRSTLLFKGEELQVADLQATRATDYFTGKGTFHLIGAPRYQAEMRAAVDDLSVYHPAYASALSPEPVRGALRLEWSGDGSPGAHSGAFRGNVERFITKAGPAAFHRSVSLEAEGSYSPASLGFRRLAVKEGEGDKRRDALKLEGALPWTEDAAALVAGRWLDPERPLKIHAEAADAPLDLLASVLAPNAVREASGTVSGALDLTGPARAPWASGAVQLRDAAVQWASENEPPLTAVNADAKIEDSVVHFDKGEGKRGGAAFQIAGMVDLHKPADPAYDLTLQSERILRAVDDDFLRADVALTLTVKGPAQGGSISGEVQLLDGVVRRGLEILPASDTLADSGLPWLPVEQWLPPALLDRQLDLHVTSAKPLRMISPGECTPDLNLAGTGRKPSLTGKLAMEHALINWPGGGISQAVGSIYFDAERPNDPRLSFRAIDNSWMAGGFSVVSYSASLKNLSLYGSVRTMQAVYRKETLAQHFSPKLEKPSDQPVSLADEIETWTPPQKFSIEVRLRSALPAGETRAEKTPFLPAVGLNEPEARRPPKKFPIEAQLWGALPAGEMRAEETPFLPAVGLDEPEISLALRLR